MTFEIILLVIAYVNWAWITKESADFTLDDFNFPQSPTDGFFI